MSVQLLAPPPPRPLPRTRRAADRAELLRLPAAPVRSPHRRRWIAGLTVAVTIAAGGGVATALVRHDPQPASVQNSARCYSEVSSDTTLGFPGVGVSFVPDAGNRESTDRRARALCAELWSTGVLPDPDADPVGTPAPVPPLVACVLADGQVGVFPGSSPTLCDQLGIAPLLEKA